jgi:hypothetical protein
LNAVIVALVNELVQSGASKTFAYRITNGILRCLFPRSWPGVDPDRRHDYWLPFDEDAYQLVRQRYTYWSRKTKARS